MPYGVLTYMSYNASFLYASVLAVILFTVVFCVFLNVIQFEVYNRLGKCHPYFYQSDACRKLIATSIATNPGFSAMRSRYQQKVYDSKSSAINTIQKAEEDDLSQLGQLTTSIQNLGQPVLGKLQTLAGSEDKTGGPSLVTQLKTLLDTTIVDPAMTKYINPLTRLYRSLFSSTT